MDQSINKCEIELEQRVMRKVMQRMLPVLFLSFIIANIDRINVGFASLTMNSDIGLSSTAFGLGAGLFFLTYVLFEVPSNLALARFGARRWIARIMFTWGLASGATAFVAGAYSFYAVRLFLGAAEAGFFPGVVFFFTLWVPFGYRARALTVLVSAAPIASVLGSPISGLLMQLDGLAGLKGWQWMFLLEALPALIMTPVVLGVLRDKPDDASWLHESERIWLKKRLDDDNRNQVLAEQHGLLDLLRSPMIVFLCVAYFGLPGFNYGLGFFLPQIVHEFGLTIVQTGFVSALPFAVGVVGMIWWGRRSDRLAERRFHLLLPLALAATALVAATLVESPGLKLTALSVCAFAVNSATVVFWSWSPTLLVPATAAAGIALINSFGNLSGFVVPYATGVIRDLTGSFSGGLQLIAGFGLISFLILFVVTRNLPGSRYFLRLVQGEESGTKALDGVTARMNTSDSHSGSCGEYVLGHSDQELARLSEQARIVDPITRRFLNEAGLSPGMRVLDVGSGAGHVAVLAAKLVGESGEVIGVDRSSVALEVAAARANAVSQRNISFRQGDLAEMTFAEPFDAVIGRYVLCFQREPAEMLKKLAQHLRPGGLIIFHETDHDSFSSFPPSPLFDSCWRWVSETCRLRGVDPCVGLKLHSAFVSAGLPAPSMRLEAVLGGGKNGLNCLHLIAGIVEIMSAEIVRLGVATAEDIGLETLVERMSTEAIARDILLVGRSEIGAWASVR